jgi:phosphoglycerate dehydrogenase-like enzyme
MNKATKILIYERSDAEQYAELLRNAGYTSVCTAATPEEAEKNIADTEILIQWRFPFHLLERPEAKSLKWIQSLGAGVDDMMRSTSIHEDVMITRIVDQFGTPMSEYVFAQLLYVYQDIARSQASQQKKKWEPFLTELLHGKTIGVAGLGSIGKEVVRKARAFDMKVYGLSYSGKKAELVDRHFGPDEWIPFVRELDILVLILPHTEQTHEIVNRDVLLAMKPSACLVNIGRGHLIAEDELIDVLGTGHLRAAILDVFQKEPLSEESPLWELPNVYITPHMSGPSTEDRLGQYLLENLNRFQNGETLKGVVNQKAGY